MRSLMPTDEAELELQVQVSLSLHLCPTLSLWKVAWTVTKFLLLGSAGLLLRARPGPWFREGVKPHLLSAPNVYKGEQQVEE